MQFLLTILLLCIAVSYIEAEEANKEHFRSIAEQCKEETGATDDDITAMFQHKELTTTEAKCMRSCSMKKGGLMDEEGHINHENVKHLCKILSQDNEEKAKICTVIIEECEKVELPDDHCEAAETFAECVRDHGKEQGLTSMELD